MRAARYVLILTLVLLPASLFATTFPVTKTADTDDGTCDPDCSLREAIDAANKNPGFDEVPVPAGNYLLTLGQLTILDGIRIEGAGKASTIFDGNAANRVLEIPVAGLFEVSDVTVRNGYTSCCADASGAGILLANGRLTLTDSTVSGNSAVGDGGGAGIANRSGYLTIVNSTVSGNVAYYPGGGVSSKDGSVSITDTAIYGNSAYRGGGLFVYRGSLELTNSTVVQNTSPIGAAGITALYAFVSISNSTVSENTAYDAYAGGIYNTDGILYLDDSTVANNYGPHTGGGIYTTNTPLRITNSTISGNTAGQEGGGIFASDDTTVIRNSTVTGNAAGDYGGGISSLSAAPLYLTNTIVAGNDASVGANCMSTNTISFGHNLADDPSCGLTATGDLVVADAMLGPLQENGGLTETHDLLPGSPAIDAGGLDCASADTDQRGVSRPQGAACDIGAVEYVPEPVGSAMLLPGAAILGLLCWRRGRGPTGAVDER